MLFIHIRRYQYHVHVCMIITVTCVFLIMVNNILTQIVQKDLDFKVQYIISSKINNSNFLSETQKSKKFDITHSRPAEIVQKINDTKIILLWSPLFKEWKFLQSGRKSFARAGCSETKCEVTSDRKRLHESDAVVFHLRTMSLTDIPRIRIWKQKWIFFNLEAPPYSRFHGLAYTSGMFNWTMTYRSDSDIVIHYGRALRVGKSTFSKRQLYLEWKKKSKMAVWMVSHCYTDGRREDYIREMKDYIDVVTFGQCGKAACPENKTNECLDNFSKQFFFYLSFENSICEEYITEKFYMSLKHNMIPVVFGGGNYSAIAPMNSFIDVFDFASPKELSSHLYQVASNFSLYAMYFQWKFEGYNIEDVPNHCNLCEKLHSDSFHDSTVYSDMDDWWVKKSHCLRWGAF